MKRAELKNNRILPHLIIFLLTLILFEVWGGYELLSHGMWRRIIKVNSLQELKVKPPAGQAIFKRGISRQSWVNSKEPLQQYIGALAWTMNQVRKVAANPSSHDSVALLKSVKSGQGALCGDMADLYQNVLSAAGKPSRKVWLLRNLFDTYDTHGTTEVLLNGKWVIMDPTFGVSFKNSAGEMLSAQEIKELLFKGANRDVKPFFYGKTTYPARIENNYLNFLLYFNNVFVIENPLPVISNIPPFCFWVGPRLYYEKLPYESDAQILLAQHMYFLFAFLLPAIIILAIVSWLLFWLFEHRSGKSLS